MAPDGAEISISSRKARALFALLVLHDGIASTRESLADYLWPDKTRPLQQQNLRQAVKDLREAFEPHRIIEATRDICRLDVENYECDATKCLNTGRSAGNLTLLPEMPEPVFDQYRNELASYVPSGPVGEAVQSASTLLEWALGQDPSRILDMLYACRELIPNMPLPQIEAALRTGLNSVSAEHSLRPWGNAQFASVLMWAGNVEEGIAVAKTAIGQSRPDQDSKTWVTSVYSAAILLVFRGRFTSAQKLLDEAIVIAEQHGLPDATNRFRHARALRLGYEGDFRLAIKALENLEPNELILVHSASFLSLTQQPEAARVKLELGKTLGGTNPDPRVESQIRVTEAYIQIAEGRTEEASQALLDLIPFCETFGIRLVQIHAIEGLALVQSDLQAREEHLRQAFELRQRYRFPLLPGDRNRLARILPNQQSEAGTT